MDSFLFSGVFDLPWWGYGVVALMLGRTQGRIP